MFRHCTRCCHHCEVSPSSNWAFNAIFKVLLASKDHRLNYLTTCQLCHCQIVLSRNGHAMTYNYVESFCYSSNCRLAIWESDKEIWWYIGVYQYYSATLPPTDPWLLTGTGEELCVPVSLLTLAACSFTTWSAIETSIN